MLQDQVHPLIAILYMYMYIYICVCVCGDGNVFPHGHAHVQTWKFIGSLRCLKVEAPFAVPGQELSR